MNSKVVLKANYSFSGQGVTYDHVELNFYINGRPTNTPVTSFKGTVYPALYGTVSGCIHTLSP